MFSSYNEWSCPSAENRREQHRFRGDAIHLHCCLSFIAKGNIFNLNNIAYILVIFFIFIYLFFSSNEYPNVLDWRIALFSHTRFSQM